MVTTCSVLFKSVTLKKGEELLADAKYTMEEMHAGFIAEKQKNEQLEVKLSQFRKLTSELDLGKHRYREENRALKTENRALKTEN